MNTFKNTANFSDMECQSPGSELSTPNIGQTSTWKLRKTPRGKGGFYKDLTHWSKLLEIALEIDTFLKNENSR